MHGGDDHRPRRESQLHQEVAEATYPRYYQDLLPRPYRGPFQQGQGGAAVVHHGHGAAQVETPGAGKATSRAADTAQPPP